jgi:hypothetical protein
MFSFNIWIRICVLNADPDSDPATQINADSFEGGFESETLLLLGVFGILIRYVISLF